MLIATGKLNGAGLAALTEKLNKLNKRAVRLGLEPMVLTVLRTETITRKGPSGLPESVHINHVEVTGCVPCINGWRVIARIEFTSCGNLVHVAPGADCVDLRFRSIGNVCEHCHTKRNRNDIIAIRHNGGQEICVGRNCLADYIRTGDAAGMIEAAGWSDVVGQAISEFESDYYGGRGRSLGDSVVTIVEAASICIRKLGWVSGSAAYEGCGRSTKNDVYDLLVAPGSGKAYADWKAWIERNDLRVCDHDRELAAKAIKWAQSVEPGDSEYLHNLNILSRMERVGWDKAGYVVSIIPAYNRACDRETERAARAADKGSKGYIGEPKVRMKGVSAVCTGLNSFEGNYGVTTLVRFEHRINDAEYAVLTWFASGDKTEDFEVGTEYTFDATCKKHEDSDKYGKQTMINRLKVL